MIGLEQRPGPSRGVAGRRSYAPAGLAARALRVQSAARLCPSAAAAAAAGRCPAWGPAARRRMCPMAKAQPPGQAMGISPSRRSTSLSSETITGFTAAAARQLRAGPPVPIPVRSTHTGPQFPSPDLPGPRGRTERPGPGGAPGRHAGRAGAPCCGRGSLGSRAGTPGRRRLCAARPRATACAAGRA